MMTLNADRRPRTKVRTDTEGCEPKSSLEVVSLGQGRVELGFSRGLRGRGGKLRPEEALFDLSILTVSADL